VIEGDDLELFERSIGHAVSGADRAAVDAELDSLGWADALEEDPRAAVSVLFEQQGSANATSSALDRVVLHASGLGHEGVGVVLPELGSVAAPGSLRGDRVTVAGVGTGGLVAHDRALVAARTDGGEVAVVVPIGGLALRAVAGIDPRLGLVEVRGEDVAVDAGAQPVPNWSTAVAGAQVAIGHELVGASRTMLALAREHALERIQFGQPIAKFQAVRHRLAETLVAIETADAMLEAAWLDGSPESAAMAKALAGRGARTAARHCQQVLAGIGFTTEHDLHRYIRRVFVLDELFGAARTLTRALGEELLATRQLPPLLPL
jgi:hypothetical protein